MTLQELLGELSTLALAYPPDTRVLVQDTRYSTNTTEISVVRVESSDGVTVVLEGV
jgi:hypothetical protein